MAGSVARRLDALTRQEPVDCAFVDTQDPPDADGVETAVVDQPTDRFRVHAELARDFADAVERLLLWAKRQGRPKTYTSRARRLVWTAGPAGQARNRRTAA